MFGIADADRFDWECKDATGTEVFQGGLYAKIPVPIANGERESNYEFWKGCEIGFADYRNGRLSGSLGYVSNRQGQEAFLGYNRLQCATTLTNSTPTAQQIEFCMKHSRFVGELKSEYLTESSACPGAPIELYTPPTINLEYDYSEKNFEGEHFFLVDIFGNVEAGRYDVEVIEWDFGDGTTEVRGSVDDFNKDPPSDFANHRYDAPINSANVTLTVTDASGRTTSESVLVAFSNPEIPLASFDSEVLGRRVELTNTSQHLLNEDMTYQWEMGDGTMLTDESPTHVYQEPGNYMIKLLVTDEDGDMDMADETITTENGVFVDIKLTSEIIDVNDEVSAKVSAFNYESSDIDGFTFETPVDANFISIEGGPSPAVLRYIPKDGSVSTNYLIKGKMSGDTEMVAIGKGMLEDGTAVEAEKREPLYIQPDLDIELSTSATSETRAGEEVTITLTITNNDNETITGIKLDALMVEPHNLLTFVSGPLDPTGANPRVNAISLAAGATTTVTWTYVAEERGVTNLRAFLTADRIRGNGSITQDDSTTLAVESAALEISHLRLIGGDLQSPRIKRPKPGTFNYIQGTLTNVGGVDVTNIDFKLISTQPRIEPLDFLLDRIGLDITPKIALLKPGKSNAREFFIPISMVSDVSDRTRYVLPLEFKGMAEIDGEEVDVIIREDIRGNINRDEYYIEIGPEIRSLLLNGFISVIDSIDRAGDDSTIGSVAVGSAEGVLKSFQKLGDGLFSAADLLGSVATVAGQASTDDGEALTKEALTIYNAIVEYNNTTTLKQKLVDLAEAEEQVTVGGVRIFADWMRDVEVAGDKGDWREVATLISEPATDIGTGVNAEKAAASLFARLYAKAPLPLRKFLKGKEKKAKPPAEDAPRPERIEFYRGQAEAWDDVRTGVPLTGNTVRLAGLSDDQYAFMIQTAKETGGTFIVRPRPETATKFALDGLNAKPVPIKTKSLNDIDSRWLGANKADEGLIRFAEPEDPLDAMKAAVDRDEYGPGDPLFDKVIDQYNVRRAEFLARDDYVANLNSKRSRILDADGNVVSEGDGILIFRDGQPKITKVSLDDEGFLIFDFNMRRVYSDVDLLGYSKGTNKNMPADIHQDVLKEAGYGIDVQHGAPLQSSDFGSFEGALDVVVPQVRQHLPGGDGGGLIIIGPNYTTKGFVNSYEVAADAVSGSNYDLYGQVFTDYSIIGGVELP